jgi:superfamily II DNA or RNA helicase
MSNLVAVVKDRIRIKGLNDRDLDTIQRSLSFPNPKYLAAIKHSGIAPAFIQIPKTIEMSEAKNGILSIPRGYNLDFLPPTTCFKDARNFSDVEVPYPDLQITPTVEQQEVLDLFKESLKDGSKPYGNYMNILEVASGKTILAALMAMQVKQKTLVFVHTQLIMNAWISDLIKMFGPEYRKEIGIIQGPKAFLGPHFTIAMAQTWFRRSDMWEPWWKNYGCQIFDECHLIPARTFIECANKSPAAYRIGITGTAERKDGLHNIMYQIFGTPFYRMASSGKETSNSIPISDVYVVKTKFKMPDKIQKTISYMHYGRRRYKEITRTPDSNRDYTGIMKALCADNSRTYRIAKKIVKCLKANSNNSILAVTHRTSHAKKLKKLIEEMYSEGEVALLISATGRKEIARLEIEIKERRIRCTVATIQLAKIGASIPPLNRLFITTPIGGATDLEQVIGRIRRKSPNKTDARVYHVVDMLVPMAKRHFQKRAIPFYRDRLKVPRFKSMYVL